MERNKLNSYVILQKNRIQFYPNPTRNGNIRSGRVWVKEGDPKQCRVQLIIIFLCSLSIPFINTNITITFLKLNFKLLNI